MPKIIVLGEPCGKQRPRVIRKNGFVSSYTPRKTVNYETLIKEHWSIENRKYKPIQGDVDLEIKAYFKIPKSTSKKRKRMMLADKIKPTKKPDIDNIAKIVSDALNGIAFDDDKQIVNLWVEKHYSDQPRIEVRVKGNLKS
jgi:Holliday junction resolvase RusA-like endonuclease